MLEAEHRETECPADVLALIPWYPDGALSTSERGAVEAHAASCSACREEIHSLLGGLGAQAGLELPAATKVLARVLDRIDEAETTGKNRRAAVGTPRPRPSVSGRRARIVRRVALAATLALAAGVGSLATMSLLHAFGAEAYYTATAPDASRSSGPLLEMIPREGVSAAELRAALLRIEGEIVGGPDGTLGRYRVRLPAGADAAAAAALLRAEEGGIASYAEALHL